MKNLLLAFGLLAFVSFGFVSCSGDDDGGDTSYTKLIGTWKTKHFLNNSVLTLPGECSDFQKYTFNSNGTYTRTTFTGTLDTTNDPEGEDCLEDATFNGAWQYKGDGMYLIHDNSVTITDANESQYTFNLTYAYNNTELNWMNGTSTTVFRKQ